MDERTGEPELNDSKAETPARMVLKALSARMTEIGKPRMAEKRTIERNGHTYVNYRRTDQIPEGEFVQTSLGTDIHVIFRGNLTNGTVALNDESGAMIANLVGQIHVRDQNTEGNVRFEIGMSGAVEEISTDRYGKELSRTSLEGDGIGEVLDLINTMEPGQVFWQDGVPHYPDENSAE